MCDIFRGVRERVTAEDAARHFGLTFDRRGWALCPFHQDKHPSMSFRAGRFRCWACGASGDSIDFTGRLLGLEPMAAVKRLDADFSLGLSLYRKPTPAEEEAARRRQEVAQVHRAFEEWRNSFIVKLTAAYRVAHIALQGITTPDDMDKLSEKVVLAIRWQAAVEFWADCLLSGDMAVQMEVFRGRKEVGRLCNEVLKNLPTRSSAA